MKKISEDTIEIIKRAILGDRTAITELIESIQDELFKFCFYLTKDRTQAEDFCQQTLLNAIENISSLKDPLKFKSWVFQSARNLFLDSRKRYEERMTEPSKDEFNSVIDEQASATEINLQIRRSLDELPDEDRLVLVLVDLNGMSYKEAAEIMNLSEASVTTRVFRARQLFIKKFE